MHLYVRLSEPSPVHCPTCQNGGGSDRRRQDPGSDSAPQTPGGPQHLGWRLDIGLTGCGREEQGRRRACVCAETALLPSPFPWDIAASLFQEILRLDQILLHANLKREKN